MSAEDNDDNDTPELRSPPPWWLSSPSSHLTYRVHSRAYAGATAIRLSLPDALSEDWLPTIVVHGFGALLLAINGCFLGWLLCFLGSVGGLLFHADQLTQSVYLAAVALAAMLAFAGSKQQRESRLRGSFHGSVRLLTVGVYVLAAFHKLNRDFMNPEVSCASGGLRTLAELWGLPALDAASAWGGWPGLFLAAEAGLALLFIVRPGLALVAGLAFHLPLTIIFAPAFAFTMASGWICFQRPEDLQHLARTLRRRWPWIAGVGLVLATSSLSRQPLARWSTDPDWCLKEAVLWLALIWVVVAWLRRPAHVFPWFGAWRGNPRVLTTPHRALPPLLAIAWLVNGVTPYLGLQFQHTAAMLSNLRVDSGCWNHLLLPESMRGYDPYVRVQRVHFRATAERPTLTLEPWRLYNRQLLWRDRARWCRDGRHVEVTAVYRGKSLEVENFCAEDGWRFGNEPLPGFRAFQKNLALECPQRCVH